MRTGRPRGGLDRAHASCYLADLSLTSWLTLYPHLQARGWWVLEGKRSEQSTWAAKHVPILGRANLTPRTWQIDLTRAVNALPQNMTSQVFSAIAAVTGQGQNPNATPAQWASSQYGYGGSGGGSSAYHVRGLGRRLPAEGGEG